MLSCLVGYFSVFEVQGLGKPRCDGLHNYLKPDLHIVLLCSDLSFTVSLLIVCHHFSFA